MKIKVFHILKVISDPRVQNYCKLPYPDHPNGCPNWGKKEGCPPNAPLLIEIMNPPYTLVMVEFDLREWTEKLKKKHPDWSERQLRCCLYWQGTVRRKLREESELILKSGEKVLYCPEANGVDLFKTCGNLGIHLERNPQEIVYKIALIGKEKKEIKVNCEES